MMHNESPTQNESTSLPFQRIEDGINVDMTPKCFPAADGNYGTQSFTVDETQVLSGHLEGAGV